MAVTKAILNKKKRKKSKQLCEYNLKTAEKRIEAKTKEKGKDTSCKCRVSKKRKER